MDAKSLGKGASRLLVAAAITFCIAAFGMAYGSIPAYANSESGIAPVSVQANPDKVTVGDFEYTIYYDDGVATSIWISKYSGSATEVTVPTSFEYGGTTYPLSGGAMTIGEGAFEGNTKIKKVAIPNGVESIANGAFRNCTNLEEAAIGDKVEYVSQEAFVGCPNLKIYLIGADNLSESMLDSSGIGVDKNGNAYPNVTVVTKPNSPVVKYVEKVNDKGGNQITIKYDKDPYSLSTVKSEEPAAKPATPLSKGATAAAANKALVKYSSEADPKGSEFYQLQAKIVKIAKTSLKVQWAKVKGAAKYVVYGNKCGKKNKMVKLATVKKTSKTFKKVNKKKVKKGTYYKFIVVALDKNSKVLSTSKTVHAATKGGKVGNDKKVKTAAKKNRVSLKAKKKFKLKARAVPASKKLTVKRHRKVSYESSNPTIAKVSAKGVITGVKKGTCYVYAYAQVGVFAKVKVTVK